MQYQLVYNEKGERLWIPILAGAAILTAPLWLGGRQQCCGNNQYPIYPQPYPYPQPIPQPYPQPYPYPYPEPIPQPIPQPYPFPYPYPIAPTT